jgi:diamine N-acetyltransferase
MLSIRKATTADIDLIRELTMQVWPPTYVPIVGEDQVAYMLQQFYSPGSLQRQMEELHHKFIIGYNGDQAVAFASYSEIEPRIYKLHKLYILPSQQGMGVGRFMINYIVGDIKSTGTTALHLNVNRYNHSAIAFYERLNFKQLRTEDIDIGSGYFMNDYVLGFAIAQ